MSDTTTKTIHLALQGGGAHGAFTWGVLDALLADGRLNFAGISGTSAGAVNAVALAHGWAVAFPGYTLAPEARVADMPPMVQAGVPGSTGKNRPWSRR